VGFAAACPGGEARVAWVLCGGKASEGEQGTRAPALQLKFYYENSLNKRIFNVCGSYVHSHFTTELSEMPVSINIEG